MICTYKDIPSLRKKLSGKRIVFVSGCFDIIHPGHIEFLEKAASLGDVLVVGVLADTYIQSHKKRKAVYSQKQRARVIEALKPVDHVILTPYRKEAYPSLNILQILRPDIFFRQEKKHAYLPLEDELNKLGITLKALSMKKVHSTTKTIKKVLRMVL